MKSTGIVRKLDDLGRVVIPMELRKTMGLGEKDPLEIFTDGERIVLQKYNPGCMVCGCTKEGMISLSDKLVCGDCLESTYQKHAAGESRRLSQRRLAGGR